MAALLVAPHILLVPGVLMNKLKLEVREKSKTLTLESKSSWVLVVFSIAGVLGIYLITHSVISISLI